MQGTYKITVGEETYEYHNVITVAGKRRILECVAGKKQGFADAIFAGIGNTAATENDTNLVFISGGSDINVRLTDPVNKKIYFKGTLPSQDSYLITELGCYSNSMAMLSNPAGGQGTSLLATFGTSTTWVDVDGTHTIVSTNNRIGVDSIQYAINTDTVIGYMPLPRDYGQLANAATFDFAYFANDLSSVLLRFKVDDSNYFEGSFAVTNGYNISKIPVGSFTTTGAPSWSTIQQIELEATSGTSSGLISIDALRLSNPVTESFLFSRVVLVDPIQKLAGVSVDIEYVLELDV